MEVTQDEKTALGILAESDGGIFNPRPLSMERALNRLVDEGYAKKIKAYGTKGYEITLGGMEAWRLVEAEYV